MDFKLINVDDIDHQKVSLIGFAIKANQYVKGFEAVRRLVEKDKIAVVLVNSQISPNTLAKLRHY